ncbi:MAG: PEP-CTERM sorting domain-containing protein [Planctomycetota bacterium]
MLKKFEFALAVVIVSVTLGAAQAVTIPVQEDVMTSAFFTGTNLVRGYAGDFRNVHRVGSDNAFGVGPETIYLTFDPANFAGFTSPVPQAILTMESAAGGFGGDGGPGNPFIVSAHAVDTDPLTEITDDTNPSGPTDWLTFFNNNILPADAAALTSVDSFGSVTFDVTAVVNDWISGSNTVFALAMTGKNEPNAGGFLHGFLNNSENPGSTFLTIVPEPTTLLLSGCGFLGCLLMRRQK